MLPTDKIFWNYFDDQRIIPLRLSNYTIDHISRIEKIDTAGVLTVSKKAIIETHTPFHKGISTIDTSLGIKKGKTKAVQLVRTNFGSYLSEYEGEISRALSGRDSEGYAAFYPHGIMEYTGATKAQMPLLVQRIDTLATNYAAALGQLRTQELQSFIILWQTVLGEEANLKGGISDGRSDRGTLRTNLELALTNSMHLIGAQYPCDVAKCMSFFDFNLLMGTSRKAAVVAPPVVP